MFVKLAFSQITQICAILVQIFLFFYLCEHFFLLFFSSELRFKAKPMQLLVAPYSRCLVHHELKVKRYEKVLGKDFFLEFEIFLLWFFQILSRFWYKHFLYSSLYTSSLNLSDSRLNCIIQDIFATSKLPFQKPILSSIKKKKPKKILRKKSGQCRCFIRLYINFLKQVFEIPFLIPSLGTVKSL